jgi:hypothetical protein
LEFPHIVLEALEALCELLHLLLMLHRTHYSGIGYPCLRGASGQR